MRRFRGFYLPNATKSQGLNGIKKRAKLITLLLKVLPAGIPVRTTE